MTSTVSPEFVPSKLSGADQIAQYLVQRLGGQEALAPSYELLRIRGLEPYPISGLKGTEFELQLVDQEIHDSLPSALFPADSFPLPSPFQHGLL